MQIEVTALNQEIFVITNENDVVTTTTVDPSPSNTAIQFQDEGVNLGTRGTVQTVDFTGAGVTASRSADKVTVSISAGGSSTPSINVEGGAERKISAMTTLTAETVAGGDLLPIVDVSDTTDAASGTNKKMNVGSVSGFITPWKVKGVYHYPQDTASGMGTLAATINSLRCYPYFVPQKITINSIGCVVSAGTTGKARVGIYSVDSNGYPSALVVDSGEFTITAPGNYVAAVNVTLAPGLYYFAYLVDTANTFFSFINGSYFFYFGALGLASLGSANINILWTVARTYGALPDPFPAGGAGAIAAAQIAVHFRIA